jgi:hypothetical protein
MRESSRTKPGGGLAASLAGACIAVGQTQDAGLIPATLVETGD